MKPSHIIIGTLFLFSSTAQAAIVSVSGPNSSAGVAPAIIAAPTNLALNDATNFGQEGFDEAQDVITSQAYLTDGGILPDSGILAEGSFVDSHMIFLNTPHGADPLTHFDVVWTFSGKILAIMSDNGGDYEAASSAELGAAGTDYTSSGGGLGLSAPYDDRGMEDDPYSIFGGPSPDFLSWSALFPNQLIVDSRVTQPGDWIRVITNAVPVPAAIWLFGTALIGFIGFSRRRVVA